jgi:hypothetical protein
MPLAKPEPAHQLDRSWKNCRKARKAVGVKKPCRLAVLTAINSVMVRFALWKNQNPVS